MANNSLQEYEVGTVLGRGGYSVVREAIYTPTLQKVAIKTISKRLLTKQGLLNLRREIEIMIHLQHPNILKILQLIETESDFHLVLEYMDGGELFDQILKRGSYNEQDASRIIYQILLGINHLHDNGIAHRDLKPENLLCSLDDRIVVADFGLAKIFGRGELLKTRCGTPHYAAPEVIRGDDVYDKSCDMWSLGVITYVLLCGYFPFHDENVEIMRNKILLADYSFPEPQWSKISIYAKDFVRGLLQVDTSKRYTAVQCLQHVWIQSNNQQCSPVMTSAVTSSPSLYPYPLPNMVSTGYTIDPTLLRTSMGEFKRSKLKESNTPPELGLLVL